jgi:hypothetical protein
MIGDFCSKLIISIKIALKNKFFQKFLRKKIARLRKFAQIKTTLELGEATKYAHS